MNESFPIILDPDYDIFERLSKAYTGEKDETKKQYETLKQELDDAQSSIAYQVLDKVITDDEVIRSLTRRHTERKRALDSSFERHKNEVTELFSEYIDRLANTYPKIMLLSEIMKYLNDFEIARSNSRILNSIVELPSRSENLFASLNQLASQNTVTIETNSLCLDCYFKYKDEPYSALISNVKTVQLPSICPRCKERGVFHYVTVNYPMGLHKIILPGTTWLQEVLIGYALSGLKSVARVFIHKKVHAILPDRSEGRGVESDVAIVTADGRLVLLEVTTQPKMDDILGDMERKIRNLNERKIPFSGIGFVTPYIAIKGEIINIGKIGKIFMAEHISNIDVHVEKELLSY